MEPNYFGLVYGAHFSKTENRKTEVKFDKTEPKNWTPTHNTR